MITRIAASLLVLTAASFAADAPKLPKIPAESIVKKKELLFSDDLQSATPAKEWHKVVDTFTFENGMLKGTQTRVKDEPTKDGKGVITAHPAVFGLAIP